MLGFPLPGGTRSGRQEDPAAGSDTGRASDDRGPASGQEPQRVMGIPADWFTAAGQDLRMLLLRPAQVLGRWARGARRS